MNKKEMIKKVNKKKEKEKNSTPLPPIGGENNWVFRHRGGPMRDKRHRRRAKSRQSWRDEE